MSQYRVVAIFAMVLFSSCSAPETLDEKVQNYLMSEAVVSFTSTSEWTVSDISGRAYEICVWSANATGADPPVLSVAAGALLQLERSRPAEVGSPAHVLVLLEELCPNDRLHAEVSSVLA